MARKGRFGAEIKKPRPEQNRMEELKMQRKMYAVLSMLALVALVLAACSPATTPTEEPAAP
jgi:hypothetical protein